MKKIRKRKNTPLFTRWLTQEQPPDRSYNYDDLQNPQKSEVRKSLIEEQGYICCYCGREIFNGVKVSTRIEHILCQKDHEDKDLDYGNMLLSCNGFEEVRKRCKTIDIEQTCDPAKGDSNIKVTPLDLNIENKFGAMETGEIFPRSKTDTDSEETLKILNLNEKNLVKLRERLIKNFLYVDAYNPMRKKRIRSDDDLIITYRLMSNRSGVKWHSQYPDEIKYVIETILIQRGLI